MTILIVGMFISLILGIMIGMLYDDFQLGCSIVLVVFGLIVIPWTAIEQNPRKQIPRDCQEIELKLKGER